MPNPPVVPTMTVGNWWIEFSPNVPDHPTQDGPDAWYFNVPTSDGVHYVNEKVSSSSGQPRSLETYSTISMAGVITAPGVTFTAVGGGTPKFRFYMRRLNDDWSGQNQYEFYRWWSAADFVAFADGGFSLSADLNDGTRWSSVMGRFADTPTRLEYFNACKRNVVRLGFTCGGNAYGHGVYASAVSQFKLTSFTLA